MAAKQTRSTEEARRGIQRGVDQRATAAPVTLGPKEGDIAPDKKFAALSVPKGGRTVRELARHRRGSGRVRTPTPRPAAPRGARSRLSHDECGTRGT